MTNLHSLINLLYHSQSMHMENIYTTSWLSHLQYFSCMTQMTDDTMCKHTIGELKTVMSGCRPSESVSFIL